MNHREDSYKRKGHRWDNPGDNDNGYRRTESKYQRRTDRSRSRSRERDSYVSSNSSNHQEQGYRRASPGGKASDEYHRHRNRSPPRSRQSSAMYSSSTAADLDRRISEGSNKPRLEAASTNNWSDSSSDDDNDARRSNKSRSTESGYIRKYSRSLNSAPVQGDSRNEFSTSRGSAVVPPHCSLQKTEDEFASPSSVPSFSASSSSPGISIKLATAPPKPKQVTASTTLTKSSKVAAAFNSDDDDDDEEMPPECRMRMKNIGRETPTSAGPNSFGKTKIGFCNVNHIAERKLEQAQLHKKS